MTMVIRHGSLILLTSLCIVGQVAAAGNTESKKPAEAAAFNSTRIITLGTGGGPKALVKRAQPSNVVQVGEQLYLVDAGSGVSRQLVSAGLQPSDVQTLFFTHLHYDHVGGLAELLGFSWASRSPQHPISIYGPPHTGDFVADTLQYLSIPEGIFAAQMPAKMPLATLVKAYDLDVTGPKVVYRDDKVRVTAVANSHYDTMPETARPRGAQKSYSYRFDTQDRSVVFTGDTGPSEALIKLAKDADILVSEVINIERILKKYDDSDPKNVAAIDHMTKEHLIPEEVGRIASQAGVKLVVLSHLVPGDDSESDLRSYIQGVRKTFDGVVVIAQDGNEY